MLIITWCTKHLYQQRSFDGFSLTNNYIQLSRLRSFRYRMCVTSVDLKMDARFG